MNEKELFALWNRTSEKSLIAMLEHVDEWKPSVANALLARNLSSDGLISVLKVLAYRDDKRMWFSAFESRLTACTLTANQIRRVLNMHNAYKLCAEITHYLQRRLLELGATVEEVISLIDDPDSGWREKAVQEFLRRDATLEKWRDALRCWGCETHADVAPLLWRVFRARFPKLDFSALFEIAQWCGHVQDEVVKLYLRMKPGAISSSADEAHLLFCVAGLVLNEPAYGGALWIREHLNDSERAKMCRKAKQFLAHAKKLVKSAR